jgi:two-component system, OmpR family, phosphate regulon response regulator PhoB
MSGRKVLIVDGKPLRRQLHAFGLRCAGYSVDEVDGEQAACAQIVRSCPHLVLMSAEEIDPSVRELVQAVRTSPVTSALPIMLLIDRAGQPELDAALEWGIDDLLLPPVAPEVFIARVRALTRMSPRASSLDKLVELQIDDDRGTIRRGNRSASLAPTERRLLYLLLTHAGEVLPRELLQFRLWGGTGRVDTRIVDVSVCRLRRSLEQLGYEGVMQTVRGKGYRLAIATTQSESPHPHHVAHLSTPSDYL